MGAILDAIAIMQRIASEWATRCFGAAHTNDRPVRALRTLEEAVELAQVLGVPEDKAVLCVKTVYSRPIGDAEQEIGGVLLTTAILCETLGLNLTDMLERELRRVLTKSPEHFAKRNQEKDHLGLTGSAQAPGELSLPSTAMAVLHPGGHPFAAPNPGGGWPFNEVCVREAALDGTEHVCGVDGPCNGLPRPGTPGAAKRELKLTCCGYAATSMCGDCPHQAERRS